MNKSVQESVNSLHRDRYGEISRNFGRLSLCRTQHFPKTARLEISSRNSYSRLHSGLSLAWDYFCCDADLCGIWWSCGCRCGDCGGANCRSLRDSLNITKFVKHYETLIKHYETLWNTQTLAVWYNYIGARGGIFGDISNCDVGKTGCITELHIHLIWVFFPDLPYWP